jgi:hypothetical protein
MPTPRNASALALRPTRVFETSRDHYDYQAAAFEKVVPQLRRPLPAPTAGTSLSQRTQPLSPLFRHASGV